MLENLFILALAFTALILVWGILEALAAALFYGKDKDK